ncbi:hypothetical protein [Stutzerimonas azotifigens]|uniref:DUF2188 domain-containing protein n=1 Tax=Stutzerimonas azotifigens TaxID=291995 RepID=A0ABR5Z2R1_9GAMM|nr:hypothetical protein [Stutzerimonas azotifigens]MBA1274496.1 hypothetical protein [Stutzerimonas azotifigens]
MTTWIIAYSKDGNTAMLKTDSEHKPDMDRAVELVTEKAEKEYVEQDVEPKSDEEQTPATRLADRFGITITGISEA